MRVGFRRKAPSSATNSAPSTSKNSRMPLTRTCILVSPATVTNPSQLPDAVGSTGRGYYRAQPRLRLLGACQEKPDNDCRLRPTAYISLHWVASGGTAPHKGHAFFIPKPTNKETQNASEVDHQVRARSH